MRLLCLALAAATLSACTIVVNPGVNPSTVPTTVPRPVSPTLPPATPTPGRSATPQPANTALPTTSPTPFQQWSPEPSASPVASYAPHVDGKTTIISGTVYDEAGAPVDGAIVKVASTDVMVPYAATATTSQGSWVVNNVPERVAMQITATKDGYTSRQQVGAFETVANIKNVVDFNGRFFISKYPEVARVEHTDNKVIFTLSEPLDSVNRRRFEANLRLVPPGGKDPLTPRLTWDNTESIATATPDQDLTGYTAILLAGDERVRDNDNNPLGTDPTGAFEGPMAATDRVQAVFRRQEPTPDAHNWATTHTDAAPL